MAVDAGLPRAWLMLAVGADRQHGGNDGYDDDPDAHYSWDGTVPNARTVAVGDRIVLWDREAVIGASLIEEIETGHAEKILYRCPRCNRADIKRRKRQSPQFRCFPCSDTFDVATTRVERVETFRSRHDANWLDLGRCLDGRTLRSLCVSPKSQLSMRPLVWDAFVKALRSAGRGRGATFLEDATRWVQSRPEGHRPARVRVRVGQRGFRQRLLASFGPVCAFTGPGPVAALEAAHLYSYAAVGQHHDDGGLLLRRDIHRLFDQGDIAVDPGTLTISLRDELARYPAYTPLQGRPLAIRLDRGQIGWIEKHWRQHRSDFS
ncbi:HNH endonuclease signature motif containing protein [Verrucosispora sp. FIM060022]|uniref:HNH endonuclease signature motif containing protein n=1 Tax=Verrucosispora sp. FIM060022 TaxID=1479020 RepID=UPI0018F47EB5|nr:HNH endonuclease signature motif containing protein [Verrucosispora sp. FIM060022]